MGDVNLRGLPQVEHVSAHLAVGKRPIAAQVRYR